MQVLPALNLFLKAAFNGYQYGEGCEPKCIGDNYGSYQYLSNDVPRGIYVWFFIPEKEVGDGGYIHPLPLQILVAGSGEGVVLDATLSADSCEVCCECLEVPDQDLVIALKL
jgi:hypothetical protein